MARIGVAEASGEKKPVIVAARELMFEGPIVKMRVPREARTGSYPEAGVARRYLWFTINVRGGIVNIFVHSDDYRLRDTTVTARAEVWKKVLTDGQEYLYVDLRPVEEGMRPTHRLVFVDEDRTTLPSPERTIPTPAPLRGQIIFAPLDAKVVATL